MYRLKYREAKCSDLSELLHVALCLSKFEDVALLLNVAPQKLLPLGLHSAALVVQHLLCLSCALWNMIDEPFGQPGHESTFKVL